MLGFGLWWLARAEAAARRRGEGFGDAGAGAGRCRGRGSAGARARDHRARLRPGRDPPLHSAPRRRRRSLLAALPLVVVVAVNLLMSLRRPAAPRHRVPGRAAVGRDLACRRSAASGRWRSRSPPRSSTLLADHRPAPAVAAREHGCRRQRLRAAGRSAWRAWWASAPWSPPCRPSRWCATGCWGSAAGRWSRSPWPPTSWPR